MRYCFALTTVAAIEKVTISVGKDMEKLEPSYFDDGNMKLCRYFGKLLGGSSKC